MNGPGECDQELRSRDLAVLVGFDDVAGLEVLVVLEGDTALETLADFAYVVLTRYFRSTTFPKAVPSPYCPMNVFSAADSCGLFLRTAIASRPPVRTATSSWTTRFGKTFFQKFAR